MNKYYGKIGFSESSEVRPGVWEDAITEKPYYGDVLRYSKSSSSTDKVIDDLRVSNQISILSDPYIMNHFRNLKYLEWLGTKWKVSDIEIQYPRLVLTIGGVYNGPTASAP